MALTTLVARRIDLYSLGCMADVDPQARSLLEQWAAAPDAAHCGRAWTVEAVRRDDQATVELQAPAIPMHDVHDVSVPGGQQELTARVYIPRRNASRTLLYLHGGGFVIGLGGYDEPLRRLASASQWRVVALHQRLAPEHPFPAAVDDAALGARWLHDQWVSTGAGIESMPGIVGDSSGGTLAAAVTQQLTAEHVPIAFQVLIYPMLDALAASRSYLNLGTGYGFTREKALWYFDQYLPQGVDRRDPRISPLYGTVVQGLPRTLVITAECDPLRDEAVTYAQHLHEGGVHVEHWSYPGMIHGFFQMTGALDASRRLHKELGAWIAAQ